MPADIEPEGAGVELLEEAHSIAPSLIELRRSVHREPEVGLCLPRTQRKVLRALDGLPLRVTEGGELSSVTAVLDGAREGPVVLLRAELDALPLTERTGLPFRSRVDGAMHACGHDLHLAMLAGAAHLLARRAHRFAGSVILMFQPGEEGHDGARLMLDEGVLAAAGRYPEAAYALHVSSRYWPGGRFATKAGPLMAASDRLTVTVRGSGGHGSDPRHARNPIPAACAMVGELPRCVRETAGTAGEAVLSVGTVHAGTAANIIPETACFEASVRTFDPEVGRRLADALDRLCRDVAAAYGTTAEVDYAAGYPATVAAPGEARAAAETVRDVFGADRYRDMERPLAASEDFSRVLQAVPGAIVQLGACPPGRDHRSAPPNHSPHVVFDDALVADGAALYAALALRRLGAAGAHRDIRTDGLRRTS